MDKKVKVGFRDLFISYGGMIRICIGIGLLFLLSYGLKPIYPHTSNSIADGVFIIYLVITFILYYRKVNKGKQKLGGK